MPDHPKNGLAPDHSLSSEPARAEEIFFQILYALVGFGRNPRTQVSALIVGPNQQIIAHGVNDLPANVAYKQERYTHVHDKHVYVEHAERNAIFAAGRMGRSCVGAALYTQMHPCVACARAIIQSGITTVNIHTPFDVAARRFSDQDAKALFAEAGVIVKLRALPVPEIVRPLNDSEQARGIFAPSSQGKPE